MELERGVERERLEAREDRAEREPPGAPKRRRAQTLQHRDRTPAETAPITTAIKGMAKVRRARTRKEQTRRIILAPHRPTRIQETLRQETAIIRRPRRGNWRRRKMAGLAPPEPSDSGKQSPASSIARRACCPSARPKPQGVKNMAEIHVNGAILDSEHDALFAQGDGFADIGGNP